MSELGAETCEDFCQELMGAKTTSFTSTYKGEPGEQDNCS